MNVAPVVVRSGILLCTVVALATAPAPLHARQLTRALVIRPNLSGDSPPAAVVSQAPKLPILPPTVPEIPLRPLPRGQRPPTSGDRDAAVQSSVPDAAGIPAPAVNFEGISSDDNLAAFGFRVLPPDTNGDVGPNHYVQMVNFLVRIYDKSGAPLTAPFALSSLFAALGGPCTTDYGDPVVVYDHLADRWLLSQFALPNDPSPPYHQCIAISQSGDPTGAYHLYDFVMPGNNLNDYPKFGVWPDAYYMTDNQYLNGSTFNGGGVFAFEREKMLRGEPAVGLYFNLTDLDPTIAGMLPADLDGLTLPPAGTPGYFAYFIADEYGDPQDAIRIFEFHADFDSPESSTFAERPESAVAVASFNPIDPSGRADVSQPSPGVDLDAISDRLMFRLQYRNFGAYESLVVNHTVTVTTSPYKPGVRYYEMRRPLPAGGFGIAEQATFSPDAESRWMGSAAMDHQGNLAVGYSVSSSTVFPSIRYAGRLATDPANQLAQGETSIIAGTGVQRDNSSRWGDYSDLTVDPVDDCTFWFTTEYYTAAGQAASTRAWQTRIAAFKFAECTPVPHGTIHGTITECLSGMPIAGALVAFSNGFTQITDGAGNYSRTFSPASYDVTVSKAGYPTPATATGVGVTNGGNVDLDLCLTAAPIIETAGAVVDAESCNPQNGVIDPGEAVTVNLSLRNTGTAATTDLIATLLAVGGVTDPSGAASYGALIPGDPPVTRSYTFTADASMACGNSVSATLMLQDGANGLGTAAFALPLGTPLTSFAQTFDGTSPPALPAGWTAAIIGKPSDPAWMTTASVSDSAPNNAFAPSERHVADNLLTSPAIAVSTTAAQLSFRNNFDLESSYDGGVLEISVGGGAFADVITAGGAFVAGGYNGTIAGGSQSPIAGRNAWTGNSAGYLTTIVTLPVNAAGQSVLLRWRLGSDASVKATGWHVDGIALKDGYECCDISAPTPPLSQTPTRTATATPTRTATITPTRSATATLTPTRTATSSPTRTATRTPTATSTSSSTTTATPTATATASPTQSATRTATATPTHSPTVTSTMTPTRTPSSTSSPTSSPTDTATGSATPTRTSTATPTSSSTVTQTPTSTATTSPTPSATLTATTTPTHSPTMTSTSTPTRTPSSTSSPTSSPTHTATGSATPTRTATTTATVTPTSTPTLSPTTTPPGPTPTPSRTPTGLIISGQILHSGNGAPVVAAEVELIGPQPATTQTDGSGFYQFLGLTAGTWSIVPHKSGDALQALTIADVQVALDSAVGLQTLAADQLLACDVTANGSVSAYDAALVLQVIDQTLSSFPAAIQCDSDWVFIPAPTPAAGGSVLQPQPAPDACQPGAISFDPLGQSVSGQNFVAVAFGDCNGDWQ